MIRLTGGCAIDVSVDIDRNLVDFDELTNVVLTIDSLPIETAKEVIKRLEDIWKHHDERSADMLERFEAALKPLAVEHQLIVQGNK